MFVINPRLHRLLNTEMYTPESEEENEDVFEFDDVPESPLDIEPRLKDAYYISGMEKDLIQTISNVSSVETDIKTAEDLSNALSDVVTENKRKIENKFVTPDDFIISNECLTNVCCVFGIDIPRVTVNHESLVNDPLTCLISNTESLESVWDTIKETIKKAWEWLKKLCNKIVDFILGLLPSRKKTLEKLKNRLDNLSGGQVHKLVSTEWQDEHGIKFAGLAKLTNNFKSEEIIKLSEQAVDISKNLQDLAIDVNTITKSTNDKTGWVKPYINKITLPITTNIDRNAVLGDLKDQLETSEESDYDKLYNVVCCAPKDDNIKCTIVGGFIRRANPDDKNNRGMLLGLNTIQHDLDCNIQSKDVPELNISTAKTLVSGRLKTFDKTSKAVKDLKSKLDKVSNKLDKQLSDLEKEIEKMDDTKEADKKLKRIKQEVLKKSISATQKIFSAYISAVGTIDNETYKYITLYASYTIKAVNRSETEKL